MSNLKGFIFRNGLFSSFFIVVLCPIQMALAQTSVDYNSVEISSLQRQYQQQLKPRTIKKAAPRRTQIQKNDLLQYQKLLNRQTQAKRPPVRTVVRQPIRQIQRPVQRKPQVQKQAQRQVQRKPQVQRQKAPAPRPTNRPAPRRDAIFEAASSGNVNLIGQLLSRGVNVNQPNNERETALHMAAAKGHYSAVIYLLNHGANINSRTVNNWLPIHHATRFRHARIAHYLKQRGSQIYAKTSDGLTAVDMARAVNDHRILGAFGVR